MRNPRIVIPSGVGRRAKRTDARRRGTLSSLSLLALLLTSACAKMSGSELGPWPPSVTGFFRKSSQVLIPVVCQVMQMLTSSVVREFTTRTHYRILNDPTQDADTVLRGTVLSTSVSPLAYDTPTGRAASVLVVVSLKVTLSDRQGKVLYQNPAYLFREQYEVSQDLASFFEEDSPAFRRLSQDFARTLVSNILEGF